MDVLWAERRHLQKYSSLMLIVLILGICPLTGQSYCYSSRAFILLKTIRSKYVENDGKVHRVMSTVSK